MKVTDKHPVSGFQPGPAQPYAATPPTNEDPTSSPYKYGPLGLDQCKTYFCSKKTCATLSIHSLSLGGKDTPHPSLFSWVVSSAHPLPQCPKDLDHSFASPHRDNCSPLRPLLPGLSSKACFPPRGASAQPPAHISWTTVWGRLMNEALGLVLKFKSISSLAAG